MINDLAVPFPLDDGHANFRDLRLAWEEKSNSSSSTPRAGNREDDNQRRREHLLLPVKSARWDRGETPILAWQREWQMEQRAAGGLYGDGRGDDDGDDESDGSSSHSHSCSRPSSSASSSTFPSSTDVDEDIEEESKRKLSAFLSKPSGLNWDDLVRSLAISDMGRRRRRRRGGGSSGSRGFSPSPPPALMLNKIITVISHSENNYEDDDVSDFGDGESHRRRGLRGEADAHADEEEDGRGHDDGRGERSDRLEKMIEGVVMGKIAVDVGDAFQRKMDRIIVTEQRVRQMDERRQEHHKLTDESTRGDDHAKWDDDRTSPPRSDFDIASDFRGGGTHGIASPPKRKSLSALGSVFSPIRSRADRGEMGELNKVNASMKSPQCQGTPRTITTSSCSRSSGSSGSDCCDDDGRTRDKRTIVVVDGNAMTFRPTEHHRQNHHLRPYHCIPPIVADKKPPRLPPPLISSEVLPLGGGVGSPSPPPPLISFASRPSTSGDSSGSSSSCSGGGWSSATTESAATATPPGSPTRVVASPRIVATTAMAGAASTRRARHKQQWHRPRRDRGAATASERGGGDDDSYRRVTKNRESSNVVALGSESPVESMKNEGKHEVNGRDNGASAAFTSSREGAAATAAGGVGRDHGTKEGGGMLPPRNDTQVDRRRSGIVVKDRQAMECSGGSAATNRTSFASKDVAVACQNEKGVVTGNILLSASSSMMTTTTTTTTTAAHHTFDTVSVIKREGGTATAVHLPILIRPESLLFNKRQPTCWQMTRHRMSKTRGEF